MSESQEAREQRVGKSQDGAKYPRIGRLHRWGSLSLVSLGMLGIDTLDTRCIERHAVQTPLHTSGYMCTRLYVYPFVLPVACCASNHQPAHTQRCTGMHEAKGRKSEDRAEYQISNNRLQMDKWHKSVTYDFQLGCGDGSVPLSGW